MGNDTVGAQISTKESFNSLNGLQTNPPVPMSMKDDLMEEEHLSNHQSENSLGNKMMNGNLGNPLNSGFGNQGFINNHNSGSFQNNDFPNNNFFNNNTNSIFAAQNVNGGVQNSSGLLSGANKSRQLHSLPLRISEEEPTKFQLIQHQPVQMENELSVQNRDTLEDLPGSNANLMSAHSGYNGQGPFQGRNMPSNPHNLNMNVPVKPMTEESPADESTRILLGEISNRGNFGEMDLNEQNLKVVTNLHNRLIDEILLQEDELIKRHEVSID